MGTLMDRLNKAVTKPDARKEPPVSDEAIILRMTNVIELAMEKGWSEYRYRFTASEVARQFDGIDDIEHCTQMGLDNWATHIVIRMIQQRDQVPKGWNKMSRCAHCGLVWSDHGVDTLSCGWCHLRKAGKSFPQPKDAKA